MGSPIVMGVVMLLHNSKSPAVGVIVMCVSSSNTRLKAILDWIV
jgi:hypothetical protein